MCPASILYCRINSKKKQHQSGRNQYTFGKKGKVSALTIQNMQPCRHPGLSYCNIKKICRPCPSFGKGRWVHNVEHKADRYLLYLNSSSGN